MYALDHDLARRRLLYARPQATLPDVVLIDVPPRYAHPSLPLGRYYPIVVETEAERAELEAFLAAPRDAPVRPDLFDRRPSALVGTRITFAIYPPPFDGWPQLLLCYWPADYAGLADDPELFARGAYTIEAFETAEALSAASSVLLATLGRESDVMVSILPPASGFGGRA